MNDLPRTRSKTVFLAALVGLGGGFLSGVFGVGGGILMVPGFVGLLHMQQRLAHGTSLAAIVPIAVAGLVGYALEGAVDFVGGAFIALGGALGAIVGTSLLHRLPDRVLRIVFGVAVVLTAVRLYVHVPDADAAVAFSAWAAAGHVLVGLLSGVLAGLLGVGGGIVIVPALVLLFGTPLLVAKGTSLFVIIPTALVGTWKNVRHRQADVRTGLVAGMLGALASIGGVAVATRLQTRVAVVSFGVLLLAVAAKTLLSKPKRAPSSASPPTTGPSARGQQQERE